MSANKDNLKSTPVRTKSGVRTTRPATSKPLTVAQTKSNKNILNRIEKAPSSKSLTKTPTLTKADTSSKQRGASTPTDSASGDVASFCDLSRIPNDPKEKLPKQESDANMIYNEYLRNTVLEGLIDETTEKAAYDVDGQLSALRKRLEYNRLLLEETDKKLKVVTQLSEQQRLLNNQKDTLKASLDRETTLKSIPQLSILREKLRFSANRVSTRNIMLDDNTVSLNQVTKLNDAITHLQKGLSEIDKHCGDPINSIRAATQNMNDAIQLTENLAEIEDKTTTAQERLGSLVLQDNSVKLIVDKLLSSLT